MTDFIVVAQGQYYLVGLVGSSGGTLALGARSELGEVTVVVTLPNVGVSTVTKPLRPLFPGIDIERTSCSRRPWTLQSRPWG